MFTKTRYLQLYVTNYTKYLYTLNHVLKYLTEAIIYDDGSQKHDQPRERHPLRLIHNMCSRYVGSRNIL